MSKLDDLEEAWNLLANVGGGNWHGQTDEWRAAVEKFRDLYFQRIKTGETTRFGRALVHIHDDLYVDAQNVVSVLAATGADGNEYLRVVYQDGHSLPTASFWTMPDLATAKQLARAIHERVNRGRYTSYTVDGNQMPISVGELQERQAKQPPPGAFGVDVGKSKDFTAAAVVSSPRADAFVRMSPKRARQIVFGATTALSTDEVEAFRAECLERLQDEDALGLAENREVCLRTIAEMLIEIEVGDEIMAGRFGSTGDEYIDTPPINKGTRPATATYIYCADCGGPIGQDNGPPDGWQLDDGRTVCQACNVADLQRISCVMTEAHRRAVDEKISDYARKHAALPPKRERIYRFKKPTAEGVTPAIMAPIMPGVELAYMDEGCQRSSKRSDPSFGIVPESGLIPTFVLKGGQWMQHVYDPLTGGIRWESETNERVIVTVTGVAERIEGHAQTHPSLFENKVEAKTARAEFVAGSRALLEYERLTLEHYTLVEVNGGDEDGPEARGLRKQMEEAAAALTPAECEEARAYEKSLGP